MVTASSGRELRVVVLADTHLVDPTGAATTPRGRPMKARLPEQVLERLAGCDAVLHAGDILDAGTLAAIEDMAPTYAVLGNNDHTLMGRLPVTRLVELGGVTIGMIHDSGARRGRAARMRRRFPGAAVVVFGHSHVPCDEVGVDSQVLFNPGSPTQRRAEPTRTMGELLIDSGHVTARRIIDLAP